ncbi:hypothetical protein ACFLTJ_00775 [Chloroflexota bacterium]
MDNSLEKGCEFGEYFFTNKLVKVSEALGGRLPFGFSPFVKGYLEGESYIELRFRLIDALGNCCEFLAIVEVAPCMHCKIVPSRGPMHSAIRQSCRLSESRGDLCAFMETQDEDGGSMFIIVPEAVENPERMKVWFIPSLVFLVGLEFSKNVYYRLWEFINLVQAGLKSTGREANGKEQVTQIPFSKSFSLPKMPDEVIKNRPEIVNAISCKESQFCREFIGNLELVPQDLFSAITVFLGHHFMCYSFNEHIKATLKVIDAVVCPTKPIYQYLGDVRHHEKETSKTKNTQGVRDTRTHKRRLSKEPQEGDQIITSKPEEVESQTSPDHHFGDCNAKNTHSGSLEDV